MQIGLFYSKIQLTLKNSSIKSQVIQIFLNILNVIIETNLSDVKKMTVLTIWFEGFYQYLPNDSVLKTQCLNIRLQRWAEHFGVPTLSFLLSYETEIERIRMQLNNAEQLATASVMKQLLELTENLIQKLKKFEEDKENNILIDPSIIENIPIPNQLETTGNFIKTYNPTGGFTTTPCDWYSQKFIEFSTNIANQNCNVLEIGAALGAATLEVLKQGATVFCNDVEPKNLAVVKQRSNLQKSIAENDKKLFLIPGFFPKELSGLPKSFFNAILICRVLHFFSGKMIEQSLNQLAFLLKEGGKLFIVCETPFLKNWQKFLPEYSKRIEEKIEWPGEIYNPSEYESSGRAATLPSFVHWITKEVIDEALIKTNCFDIEHSSYIDRKGQFPDDLIFDGKESVGVIAVRK